MPQCGFAKSPAARPSLYSSALSAETGEPQVGAPTRGNSAGCSVQTTSRYCDTITE